MNEHNQQQFDKLDIKLIELFFYHIFWFIAFELIIVSKSNDFCYNSILLPNKITLPRLDE